MATRIGHIVKGERSITAKTAVKLGKLPAEFWMNLQTLYDIEEALKRHKKDIESIKTVRNLQHSAA